MFRHKPGKGIGVYLTGLRIAYRLQHHNPNRQMADAEVTDYSALRRKIYSASYFSSEL